MQNALGTLSSLMFICLHVRGAGNSPLALTHLGVNKGVGDSKEKNRQAQRRFRER